MKRLLFSIFNCSRKHLYFYFDRIDVYPLLSIGTGAIQTGASIFYKPFDFVI